MPIPMLANPPRESEATCETCGTTLMRSGLPATFSDGTGKPVNGKRPYKGWIPALLVTICPACDVRVEPIEAAEPAVAAVAEPVEPKESYLERLARENES